MTPPATRRGILIGAAALAGGGAIASSSGVGQVSTVRGGPAVDPRTFGVTFDGTTDDTAAWQRTVSAADHASLPIVCPPGRSLITASLDLPERTMIVGAGRERTILLIRNGTAGPTLYGLRCRSGLLIADIGMILVAQPDPARWVAALGFADKANDLRFERMTFSGGATPIGTLAGFIDGVDVDDVRFTDCSFRALEIAGVLKNNADLSHQRDWQWIGCRGIGCTDGINVNSPLGSWSHGRIVDCDFSETLQFPFALAGPACSGWTLDVSGRDNDYELVHLEDGVNATQVVVREAVRCNRKSGMRGSPAAANGIVSLLGGCRDVTIDITATLDSQAAQHTAAVVAQAGGKRASQTPDQPPSDIVVRGRISLGARGSAVIAFDGTLRFDDLRVEVQPGVTRLDPVFSLSGCAWSGSAAVRDPGALLAIDPNSISAGAWDRLKIEFTRAPAGFTWLTGVFPEERNATPIARALTLSVPASGGADRWTTLCPAPFAFEGVASIKRAAVVQGYALGRLSIRAGAISGFVADAVVQRRTAPGGVSEDGAGEVRIAGGMLQLRPRATGGIGPAPAATSTIALTLDGAFFPPVD